MPRTADNLLAVGKARPQKVLEREIREALGDRSRSSRPRIFAGEQAAAIMDRACMKPSRCGHERDHWTCDLLAKDAVKRRIAESIPARTVARFLKEAQIKPWHIKYWMHSPDMDENPEKFYARATEVCGYYLDALTLRKRGGHLVCVDEKSDMQALEHKCETRPSILGKPAPQEYEYIRHGTLTIITGFEVAEGKILPSRIGKTRTERVFMNAIKKMVATDPDAEWIIICDGLNIHESESLVRFVAEVCGIEDGLGKKDSRGILKSMKTREEFLHDETHGIRFVYTPRHSS